MYKRIFSNLDIETVQIIQNDRCLIVSGKLLWALHIQTNRTIDFVTKTESLKLESRRILDQPDNILDLDIISLDSQSADSKILKDNLDKFSISRGYQDNIFELISHTTDEELYSNILIDLDSVFYLVKPEFFSKGCFLIRSTPYPQYLPGDLPGTTNFHTNAVGTLIFKGVIRRLSFSNSNIQLRTIPAIQIQEEETKELLLTMLKDEGYSLLPSPLTSTKKLNTSLLKQSVKLGPYVDIVTLRINKMFWLVDASILVKSDQNRRKVLFSMPN